MPSISVLLLAVHDTVHDFHMKLNYSEPKIYIGGIDPKQWSKLSKAEQKTALNKHWYVYFSFRDPLTGVLKRQPNIKGGANTFLTKRDRLSFLKVLQRNLSILLQVGFNPYVDNSELEARFLENYNGEIPPLDQRLVSNHSLAKKHTETESKIVATETIGTSLRAKTNEIDSDSAKKSSEYGENDRNATKTRIQPTEISEIGIKKKTFLRSKTDEIDVDYTKKSSEHAEIDQNATKTGIQPNEIIETGTKTDYGNKAKPTAKSHFSLFPSSMRMDYGYVSSPLSILNLQLKVD